MDVVKKHNKAGKEEEEGNVKKGGQGIDGPWQETLFDAFGKKARIRARLSGAYRD